MGAKTWMLVYADTEAHEALSQHPTLDREATSKLAAALFPKEKLEPLEDGSLAFTSPPDDELCIGCFPGVSVVAAKEFGIDYPSKLPSQFLERGASGTVVLHAMHSVVDWFAYAIWVNGTLKRSLSVSPDSGILEDIGERLPFEEPYWSGERPAIEDPAENEEYPLPFHPLEMAEAALEALFGYQLEGPGSVDLDPDTIPLLRYRRSRSLFGFLRRG